MSLDVVLSKRLLENLVVVHVLVLGLSIPLAFVHGHVAVDSVDNLTVDGSSGTLFDFRKLELELEAAYLKKFIEPA
jgi:hypothetical protein